jgi:pantothenate kinase type III
MKKSQLDFGHNTVTSISSGANHMAQGFVSSVSNYAKKHYKITNTIITGGKSAYIDFANNSNIKTIDNAILIGYNYLINKLFRHK